MSVGVKQSTPPPRPAAFAFRPWVRRSCQKAMLWGLGVVALLGGVAWMFRTPGSAPLGRAFAVLLVYGMLFWLTLLKIWWTAGRPAVVVGRNFLSYQPLHLFRRRRIAYLRVLSCAPRKATESLRIVYEKKPGQGREFFLNLAVVDGRHAFVDLLGERLEAAGLQPVAGEPHSWNRPGWHEPPLGA
jgi:hypothetical protein